MTFYHRLLTTSGLKKVLLSMGLIAACLAQTLSASASSAEPTIKEINIANNQAITIESNQNPDWPQGPVVSAASAILMEADTGTILYAKDIHSHHYPASITKILTTLIASEECSLNETVTFSHDAVFGIPRGSNHIAMNEGDTLTMEQCLNAILIRSANEVSYAVAEHIGGTWDGFADMMNARAKELGCVDSHFVNPNGLPDENHYVSAYDMAMIGRAFFANEMLCKMTLTQQLIIPKKDDTLVEWNKMDLLPGHKYAYEGVIGCKTGYTDDARSTLVSCAERNGMKLICVVLQDEAPYQYDDTIALFDYGFGNFDKINISQTETKYNIDNTGSLYSDNAIFGNSQPLLSLNKDSSIILPKSADFSDTISEISYETGNEHQVAIITYTYAGVAVGSASVDLNIDEASTYRFDENTENMEATVTEEDTSTESSLSTGQTDFIFINIFKVLLWSVGIALAGVLLFLVAQFLRNYHFSPRKRNTRRSWLHSRLKRRNAYQDMNSSLRAKRKAQIKRARKRRRKRQPNRFRDYDF
ncbi:MAG: D-alanyl-D-alanine carboxypeptidase [Lachnospiraceae bacterium]|nr:D-alanyl-D-alanine carboxypeptidase [Lachnospiraceae bacterium]